MFNNRWASGAPATLGLRDEQLLLTVQRRLREACNGLSARQVGLLLSCHPEIVRKNLSSGQPDLAFTLRAMLILNLSPHHITET